MLENFLSPDGGRSSASTAALLYGRAGWTLLILQGPLQVYNEKVNQLEADADCNLQRGPTLNAKHPRKLWKCEASVRSGKLCVRLTCCSFTTSSTFIPRSDYRVNLRFATDEMNRTGHKCDTREQAQVFQLRKTMMTTWLTIMWEFTTIINVCAAPWDTNWADVNNKLE